MKHFISILFFLVSFYMLGVSQSNEFRTNEEKSYTESVIYGNIYMDKNLLDGGRVFLLNNSKKTPSTSKNTSVLDGTFKFENVNVGAYSIYVIPTQNYDFLYFPKYLPTYSGNVYKWEDALINTYKSGKQRVEVQLTRFSEPFYGNEEISGKIEYDIYFKGNKNIPISVILLNKDKIPMDFRVAEEDGSFIFEYLPKGKYYIHPEIPGFKTDDYEINLTRETSNNNANFRIKNRTIKYDGIIKDDTNTIIYKNSLKVFVDKLNKEPIICELTDLSGKSIFKKTYLTNEITINTSNISGGVYLLRARTYSNLIIKTSKVFINRN